MTVRIFLVLSAEGHHTDLLHILASIRMLHKPNADQNLPFPGGDNKIERSFKTVLLLDSPLQG